MGIGELEFLNNLKELLLILLNIEFDQDVTQIHLHLQLELETVLKWWSKTETNL